MVWHTKEHPMRRRPQEYLSTGDQKRKKKVETGSKNYINK
jgi:hypothetical protein